MSATLPSADTLVQHTGWLRALALRLVRDASRADDVVQRTLLQALRRPPRDASAMPAWLARVAKNEARQMGRSDQARVRREQRVGEVRTATPTADVVERAEIHQRLVDAVLSLDEPFRTVVLLRYFDGLEPKAIAEHLGWAPGTVRSRLKRGLDRLRKTLDEERGGDGRSWVFPLLVLVDPKDVVTAGGTSSLVATGALLMGTKTKVGLVAAVLILLLVGGALWWTSRDVPETETTPGVTTAETGGADGVETRLEGNPADAGGAQASPPVAAPPVPASSSYAARLRFTDGAGRALEADEVKQRYREAGFALTAVLVEEAVLQPTDVAEGAARRLSGSDEGRSVVSWGVTGDGLSLELEPGTWRLFVARPGAAPLLTSAFVVAEEGGEAPSIEIPLPSEVPGRTLDLVAAETGKPLEAARVLPYFEYGDDLAFFEGEALVAQNGRVQVPHMELELGRGRSRPPSWWVEAPGRLAPVPWNVLHGEGDGVHSLEVPLTAEVAGTAWRQDGQPAAGLEVVWTRKGRSVRTTVADDGSFLLVGLPANRSSQGLFLLEDVASLKLGRANVTVKPGERSEVVIGSPASQSPRAVLHGRITCGGAPWTSGIAYARAHGGNDDGGLMAKMDAEGRYRLEVEGGALEFGVWLGGADDFTIRAKTSVDVAAGEERQFDFELPEGALLVRVLDDETGEPVPGATAYAAPQDRDVAVDRFEGFAYRAGSAATADAEGGVLLRALVPGEPHRVIVSAPGYAKSEQQDVLPSATVTDPVHLEVRLRKL